MENKKYLSESREERTDPLAGACPWGVGGVANGTAGRVGGESERKGRLRTECHRQNVIFFNLNI